MKANLANWELAGDRLAANKPHGIGSVHRLVYLRVLTPAFLAVSEVFSDTGIGTTLKQTLLIENIKDIEYY